MPPMLTVMLPDEHSHTANIKASLRVLHYGIFLTSSVEINAEWHVTFIFMLIMTRNVTEGKSVLK